MDALHGPALIEALAQMDRLGDDVLGANLAYPGVLALAAQALKMSGAALAVLAPDGRLMLVARYGDVPLTELPADGPSAQVLRTGQPLVVQDARSGAAFQNHPMAGDDGVRFYAGLPLTDPMGQAFGVVAVIDRAPRAHFSPADQATLRMLNATLTDALLSRARRVKRLMDRELLADGPMAALMWRPETGWPVHYRSDNLGRVIGQAAAAALAQGTAFEALVHPQDRQRWRTALRSHQRTPLDISDVSYRIGVGENPRRWIRQTTRSRRDAQGQLTMLQGYLLDDTRQKRLEHDIQQTQERLFLALESAQLGTWEADLDQGLHSASPRVSALLGLRPEELGDTVQDWLDRIHPFDRALANSLYQLNNSGTDDIQAEYRVRHRDGSYRWVQTFARVLARDETGLVGQLAGTLRDITADKRLALQREGQGRLSTVLSEAQAVFIVSQDVQQACASLLTPLLAMAECRFGFVAMLQRADDGSPQLWLPAVARPALAAPAPLAGDAPTHPPPVAAPGLLLDARRTALAATLDGQTVHLDQPPPPGQWPTELPVLDNFLGLPVRSGTEVLGIIGLGNRHEGFDQALIDLLTPLTVSLGALIRARNVELARQSAEARLYQQASTDPLTGLASREALLSALQSAIARGRRSLKPVSLTVIDLDKFQQINDRQGQRAGDQVLRRFAGLASALLRSADVVGRLGGDEFALLMPDTPPEQAQDAVLRLQAALARTGGLADGAPVQFSAGMACWTPEPGPAESQPPGDRSTADALLATTIARLQAAQAAGGNRLVGEPANERPA